MENKVKLLDLKQQLFDCELNYSLLPVSEREKKLEQYEKERKRIRHEITLLVLAGTQKDNKTKTEELKQQLKLFECELNYSLLPVSEREKKLEQYEKERKRIRHEIALSMLSEERDEKNDKHKRR